MFERLDAAKGARVLKLGETKRGSAAVSNSQGPASGIAPSLRRPQGPVDLIPQGGAPHAMRRRDALNRRSLAVADMLAAALAVSLTVAVLGHDKLGPAALPILPLVVVVSKVVGLYDRDERLLSRTTLDEAPALFQVATLSVLLTWFSQGVWVQGTLGRNQVLGMWVLLFVSMTTMRASTRGAVKQLTEPERCLVVGDADSADRLQHKIESSFSLKATVIGRVPLDAMERPQNDVPILGTMETLGIVLAEHSVDRVVIAPRGSDSEEIFDAIRLVKALGVKVSVLPRLFEVVGSSVEFDDVDGLTLLGLPTYALSKSSRALKRSMDVLGSALGLAVLAPLYALIAAAIKFSSPGPVFFRQARVGADDEQFEMLKFRTMYLGADGRKAELRSRNEAAEGLFKIKEDPRITPVGRFLRRSSLDELPQMINVLRGEMSLVGPRPLVPDEDSRLEGWQRKRLQLKPGMTGLWQIFGSSRIPLQEMVKIDYLYTTQWSLWTDVKTLLRTVPHVLSRRGL